MEHKTVTKLWGGRFRQDENELMEQFNNNLSNTTWLCGPDIQGSLAHVAMQVKCGLLTVQEGEQIAQGLQGILADVQSGALQMTNAYEDVHTFVEVHLIERIGDVGKKLHTARSRNDQVNTDMKLYVKQQTAYVIELVEKMQRTLQEKAAQNPCIMPGYTHLQRAQVVTFKYYLMAYHGMLQRDKKRLQSALDNMDLSPLGCGALAGTTHQIDRAFTAEQLGFSGVYANFIDGVSDRDYQLEAMSAFSILMMHLSRLSEEIILWSSQEFGFISLDDNYTTGSSIMPQKKNSDGAELIRGKTGRVYGDLMGLLTVMKGLPLAYNKDMQEDKEAFHDSLQTVILSLCMMERMIATLTVKKENMEKAVKKGFLNATEVADYLVGKGIPFRDAHGIVGQIVIYCEDHQKAIEELQLSELQQFCPVFDDGIYPYIDYHNILKKGIKKEML
ncbi:argininosuccinate lyase [Neobittarella massiliensis]|uniref:Argininosuccinate lyase n=1 Tax=Neobittarella massiliensis (ex Bilen et al. 2018) TaxID=2041842 RepID=A0A8J6LZY2_9FIRM|nr:argininosuccinate lyase [Neobittarella massiliensis]MBC3517113.1 argininosuccinate lyase [Neobittarella massiliensis]